MAESQVYQDYFKLCESQTGKVRTDIEVLGVQLRKIDADLQQTLSDEENLIHQINQMRRQQESLDDRIKQAGQKLAHYKSYLASFQS